MTWYEGPLVGFDIESTGVDVEDARIVSASAVYVGGGHDPNTRTWLVNPGIPIPDGAAAVHGITTEKAQAEGTDAATAIGQIIAWLGGFPREFPLVAFNARFDLTILDREARRYGIVPLQERGPLYVVDPLLVDKFLDRYRKGSRKLEDACAAYGARLDVAHDSGLDAIAAARMAWVLGTKGRVIRKASWPAAAREKAAAEAEWAAVRNDLPLLHEAQAAWAAEQAAGLAAHWREKIAKGEEVPGDPDDIRGEWPIITRGTGT